MNERDRRSEFLEFMRMPNGSPLATIDVLDLQERGYRVVIVSSRCTEPEGIIAIRDWLKVNGFPCLEVMAEKPPAVVYVDDRAICFDGDCKTLYEKINNFKPWYQKGV